MLERMENQGLISRVQSETDKRKTLLFLTEKAHALKGEYDSVSDEMSSIYYKGFSEEEITQFEECLDRITNIIDGALTSIWLLNDRIMNSEFFDGTEQLFGTDAEVISHVFIHFNKVFLSIIILALTINGIETVVKAVKYSRQ